ncbi:LysR family transcriptional regulator [Sphingomonas sp. H39-1-10]|uniref:LysR family transcriptional regulator n=1 Tax=Sphingomonas pollutisoli TaxID=3030829 RepID=UPI0023B9584B|nr:LysR family transcriptional regulator [Sphingomonas pollutisoli]MDF0489859.1 LysR family transcriptional regulator [Sphingomonas pollutisoli]
MRRDDLVDLNAFLAVAEERSFTRAAARLGVSQSALSHTVRRLETRLGVRLLSRTTRSVAPTEAGERLVAKLGPAFDEIEGQLSALGALRERPAGTIRITATQHSAETVLWPAVSALMADYPEVKVEISVDSGLRDIVAERFDAGVRLSERVAADMIAVRIGPDLRMAAVGAPDYFARHPAPASPQDLAAHRCINLRLSTLGDLYAWELDRDDQHLRLRVDGQFTSNHVPMILRAARAGFGIAFLPDQYVHEDVASGALVRVLEDWCPPFAGYHLYYPSRRQPTPAFALLLDLLREGARG